MATIDDIKLLTEYVAELQHCETRRKIVAPLIADIRARIELEETSEIPLIIDAVIVQINRLKETL